MEIHANKCERANLNKCSLLSGTRRICGKHRGSLHGGGGACLFDEYLDYMRDSMIQVGFKVIPNQLNTIIILN